MKERARHRNMSGISLFTPKRSIFATKYQKKNRNEENLSCIPSAYYIVCLRQQKYKFSLPKWVKSKGWGMIPFIYMVRTSSITVWTLCLSRMTSSLQPSPTDTLASTWLQFSDGTEYPLYLDKGDNIKIKGSAAELTSLEITGNVPNEELTAFQKELKGLSTPSEKALEEKAEAFINSHPSSLVSIYLLEKYFVQNRNRTSP